MDTRELAPLNCTMCGMRLWVRPENRAQARTCPRCESPLAMTRAEQIDEHERRHSGRRY